MSLMLRKVHVSLFVCNKSVMHLRYTSGKMIFNSPFYYGSQRSIHPLCLKSLSRITEKQYSCLSAVVVTCYFKTIRIVIFVDFCQWLCINNKFAILKKISATWKSLNFAMRLYLGLILISMAKEIFKSEN